MSLYWSPRSESIVRIVLSKVKELPLGSGPEVLRALQSCKSQSRLGSSALAEFVRTLGLPAPQLWNTVTSRIGVGRTGQS